jgi:hypothetical protein
MKAFSHLWQFLVELFLEREIIYTKAAEKIKTPIYVQYFLFENYDV